VEGRRAPDHDRRLLGDVLIEAGLVRRAGLVAGLEEQRLRGGRLGYNLLRIGAVTPAALHLFLRENLPALAPDLLEALRASPAIGLIPKHLAHHYGMVPLKAEDGTLALGLANADTPRLIPAVEALTGLRVDPLICPPALLAAALDRFYPADPGSGVIHRLAGDHQFVLSDRRLGLRPHLPELLRSDAPAADWLRAIAAEGVRRGARHIAIEPPGAEARASFGGPRGAQTDLILPAGAYAGLARLIDGLSRIGARGRIVPREGRFALVADGRRLSVSVLALPGLEGERYALDLRRERVAAHTRGDLERDRADLRETLDGLAGDRAGLLLLAGATRTEAATGLAALLTLLGDRLPRRAAIGDWPAELALDPVGAPSDEEAVPLAHLIEAARSRRPDLVVLPDLRAVGCAEGALALARECAVVAALEAVDACDAAEWLTRSGLAPAAVKGRVAGILATRLMEALCGVCRRPFDVQDLLSPPRPDRVAGPGPFHVNRGCAACRGSGVLRLEPVFEFLPASREADRLRPGVSAERLRVEQGARGRASLVRAALARAAAGLIDVREPLRVLLHEQH
jgi:type II secretory ATPase GspE/PulE/Tfp pilus assembly ATPase PilB-like protein